MRGNPSYGFGNPSPMPPSISRAWHAFVDAGNQISRWALTFMATLKRLVESGVLEPIQWPFLGMQKAARAMYGTVEFVEKANAIDEWLKKPNEDRSPYEQFLAIMNKYFRGWRMNISPDWDDVKSLTPHENGIWELRTEGLRILGWFVKRDHFVAHGLYDKDEIADHGLTTGLANAAAYHRDKTLGFKPGELILTGRVEDVLSNQV